MQNSIDNGQVVHYNRIKIGQFVQNGGFNLREKLKKLRKAKNISVEQIAKELNISKSFYYKIESGDRNPTIILAKDICKLFGVDMDEIF